MQEKTNETVLKPGNKPIHICIFCDRGGAVNQ